MSAIDDIRKARDDAKKEYRTKIAKPVHEELFGSVYLTPAQALMEDAPPAVQIQAWREEEARDPYHGETFLSTFQQLQKFGKDDRQAALDAWKAVEESEAHILSLEQREAERMAQIPMVPVGSITQQHEEGPVDVAYPQHTELRTPPDSDGMVVYSGKDDISGNHVIVQTRNPESWMYHFGGLAYEGKGPGQVIIGHLDEAPVAIGQRLEPDQPFGFSGASGKVTAPSIHIGAHAGDARRRVNQLEPLDTIEQVAPGTEGMMPDAPVLPV